MKKIDESYIGKLFIHTKKAIRNGAPNFRLYCVMAVESKLLLAWPVDREAFDEFFHPAFCQNEMNITIQELRKCNLCINYARVSGGGGIRAISCFRPDSYYKEVCLEQAIKQLVSIER